MSTCTEITEGAYENVMCTRAPAHDGPHFWASDGWSPSITWLPA